MVRTLGSKNCDIVLVLVFHHTDTSLYLLSLALALSIHNKLYIVTLAVSNNVEAVVNAANENSFTTGDEGISGALRDAMYPQGIYEECIEFKKKRSGMTPIVQKETEAHINVLKATAESRDQYDVCGARKVQQDGSSVSSILECEAAWQSTNGYLKKSGVTHVIHPVGPKWTDVQFLDVRSRGKKTNTFVLVPLG